VTCRRTSFKNSPRAFARISILSYIASMRVCNDDLRFSFAPHKRWSGTRVRRWKKAPFLQTNGKNHIQS
jgi:hypothetical protein